jgi:hypothetical protein
MAINTTFTSGNVLTAAQMNNLPRGFITYTYNTTAVIFNLLLTVQELFRAPAFTPVAGRVYRMTTTIGSVTKTTNIGNIDITVRQDNIGGNVIDQSYFSAVALGEVLPYSKTTIMTSTQMGTTLFTPLICVQANTAGMLIGNGGGYTGSFVIEDIGAA